MKGMRKISRGSGFAGVLSYAAEGKNKESGHGRLIGGNMAAVSQGQLAKEFRAVAAQRQDIEKPVWHSSLRMPNDEDVSDEKWQAIAADYMQSMGWEMDRTQYCVWKHKEEHIHIIANRVMLNGSVFLGQNENLKNTRVIAELEKRHGLTITKGPELDNRGRVVMPDRRRLRKKEIEKSLRTGDQPPRELLQEMVANAMTANPSVQYFLLDLERSGVDVIPNISSTGTMNGFGFSFNGVHFSASKLGEKFKWSNLQKALNYSKENDNALLFKWKSAYANLNTDSDVDGTSRRERQLVGRRKRLFASGSVTSSAIIPLTDYRLEHSSVGVKYSSPAETMPAFIDRGNKVEMTGYSDTHIDAFMQVAAQKWNVVEINGDFNFKKLCVMSAVKQGLNIIFADTAMETARKKVTVAYTKHRTQHILNVAPILDGDNRLNSI
ncbi:MAG: relaxase/mobilization nuclease domain-containing protein [Burkholderiaceae bacterium]